MNIPYAMKKCSKCGQWLVANRVNFYKQNTYKDKLDNTCISCRKERQRELDEIRWERSKRHKEINDKNRKARKKFYRKYFGYEYQEKYRKSPKGQIAEFNRNQKRRAKEQAQGNGITVEQWTEMMQYFGWKCAYSGETLNKKIRSVDHIIPLDKGGANEIWNLVPMNKFYNSSKHTKDMLEWYKQQNYFSEERLAKIKEWQEYAFNKWYKEEK